MLDVSKKTEISLRLLYPIYTYAWIVEHANLKWDMTKVNDVYNKRLSVKDVLDLYFFCTVCLQFRQCRKCFVYD